MDDNEPSTSNGDVKENEEIVQLWRHLDETLENKAKSMNLTSLNVKSILHHLIKYPNAVDIMMGIRAETDVPNVRLTRSSQRKSANDSQQDDKMSILCAPKTFLDLNFDDNDEFDEDYADERDSNIEEDEEDEEDEEEEEEEEEEEGEEYEECNLLDPYESLDLEDEAKAMNSRENLNDSLIRADFYNIPGLDNSYDEKMKNPEYRDFLNAVRNENVESVVEDDTDDEDYDVQIDDADLALDVEDWYETRHDRAAQIPRYEVERLMMDTILAEKEIPLPKEVVICEQEYVDVKKTLKQKDAEVAERVKKCQPTTSCSLFVKNVTFRDTELDTLKIQLEQHVQLLTQTVVTCYHEKSLFNLKNQAQFMINELDQKYFDAGENPFSIYNISNLAGSIESCHDIINMEEVGPKYVKWAENTDGVAGFSPRPEAISVLARSSAIKYPHLLPKIQPFKQDKYIPFLKSEDVMLALGLLQFVHLPRKADKFFTIDRYTAIHNHCLPSRNALNIRNRMKTVRSCGEKGSPLHQIIIKAEQGISLMDFAPTENVVLKGSIENWPSEYQPNWYKKFITVFKVIKNQVLHIVDSQFKVLVMPTNKNGNALEATTIQVRSMDESQYYLERGYTVTISKVPENEPQQVCAPEPLVSDVGDCFVGTIEDPESSKTTSRMSFVRPKTPTLGDGEDSQFTVNSDIDFSNFAMRNEEEEEEKLPETSTASTFNVNNNNNNLKRRKIENLSQREADEDPNRKWRKRSRVQKEQMGKIGMDDQNQRNAMKVRIARKIIEDVKKRLFMHQEKYSKFLRIMKDKSIYENERVTELIEIFQTMPDLMHLVLMFTPVEHLPDEILSSPLRRAYKEGIEMIIDISAYLTSARIKSPTVRQQFKLISKLAEKKLPSSEAVDKLYTLLGNERPLWERLEKYFDLLPYNEKSEPEDFEFIDLTDKKTAHDFDVEYIDDLCTVTESNLPLTPTDMEIVAGENATTTTGTTSTSTSTPMVIPELNSLCCRSGQLMASTEKGVIAVEVREFVPNLKEEHHWSKEVDMILLEAYNQALEVKPRNPIDHVASTVSIQSVDQKTVKNRLKYLLSIMTG